MVVLFKVLLLKDLIAALEGVDKVENDRAVAQVVPDLHEIHAVTVWQKGGVIAVKAHFLPHDLVPVAKIEIEIAAALHKRVHLLQNTRDLIVRHIGERVAGAHHTVEFAVEMASQLTKIALPQVDGDAAFIRFFAAARKHTSAQVRAVQRNAKVRKRQRE